MTVEPTGMQWLGAVGAMLAITLIWLKVPKS